MISVRFFISRKAISGFEVKGHADFAESGRDIVCASVSSAAYMTANTLTDVLLIKADVTEKDGLMRVSVPENDIESAQVVLKGFYIHMKDLAGQYPRNIKIIYGGKKNA